MLVICMHVHYQEKFSANFEESFFLTLKKVSLQILTLFNHGRGYVAYFLSVYFLVFPYMSFPTEFAQRNGVKFVCFFV